MGLSSGWPNREKALDEKKKGIQERTEPQRREGKKNKI